MKKLLLVSAFALTLSATSAFAETLTGVVSDAMCAKNPAKASSAAHADCAAGCIKGGSPAVLIVGDKVITVTNPEKLSGFAGKKITVEGKMVDGKLTVESVKA